RKVVYRNRADGRFEDVTERLGEPVTIPRAGRGAAFADFDNDGDVDVIVNNVHETPNLYRLDLREPKNWLAVRLVGVASNRSAIGARVRLTAGGLTQVEEVRGGGSYYSQNDLRRHFGLGSAGAVDRLDVRWPNGLEEAWVDIREINRVLTLTEGTGQAVRPSEGAR
ncbi:MAG: CRTAC1 family protein, partial [Acidobacteria bacterium]|nr:CRTAC1 family protein [Acidobacteriota bacterium]